MNRREFLALLGLLGTASCARLPLHIGPIGKLRGGNTFSVATMGDLHITTARSIAYLNRVVKKVNTVPNLHFTAVLGDVTSQAKLGEFEMAKKALDGLNKPYFVVPGNHDVEPGVANPYGNYEHTFKNGNWIYEEEGWTFIGVDSCDGVESDVAIRPDRMDWLRKQLKHISKNRPIGLFTHHPLNPNTKAYRIKNADEVLALFSEHSLKLVASGHYHGNQVETQNGILFTTTACCSSTRNNADDTTAKGFRLFHFSSDTLETEFVEVA